MSTQRQQIVEALISRLQTITMANGYRTNLNSQVYPWPDPALDSASLPALVIHDGEGQIDDSVYPLFNHHLTIDIQVTAAGSLANAALSDLMADIIKAIGTDNTFGGLALGTTKVTRADKVDMNQYEKVIGDAIVTLEVHYRTPQWEL